MSKALLLCQLVLVASITCGCAKPPSDAPRPAAAEQIANPAAPPTALAGTASRYDAQRFSGRAELNLTYTFADGRQESEQTTITTAFARPNKVRLAIESDDNRVAIAADGKILTAQIRDPVTQDFDGQTVVRDAPSKLTLADLYAVTELVDPVSPGEMLSVLLGAPAGLDMTPLGLVFQEGSLYQLVQDQARHQQQGREALRDARGAADSCDVIAATTSQGTYRCWISTQSGLLRRIEFPPLEQNLAPGISRIRLVADFYETELGEMDMDFSLDPPEGQQVNHFVLPPLPPSSPLLGQRLGELDLESIDGRTMRLASGAGTISVLVWFHDHPTSQLVLQQMESLRSSGEYAGVRFAAVTAASTEGGLTGQTILQEWGVAMTLLRDPLATGRDVLEVNQAPSTVVLDRDHRLHYFEVGANPQVGAVVGRVLAQLRQGKDVAKATLRRARESQLAYQRHLALAKTREGWIQQQPSHQLPPASRPAHVVSRQLWVNSEMTAPGNMLIVPGQPPRLLVLDGWNALCEISATGTIQRRIALELPAEDGVSVLRAGKDHRERALVAATTRGGRRAYVFDLTGKLVLQYPSGQDGGGAIRDIAFARLLGKGPGLAVGWQDGRGVQGVGLDGTHLWSNRVLPSVASLTVLQGPASGPARDSLLATHESGTSAIIDASGRTLRQINPGTGNMHLIVGWPGSARGFATLLSPADGSAFCGLAMSADGNLSATGLDASWNPRWSYTLPTGIFQHQIDMPQSLTIPEIGDTWILAGPEGSVHLVSTDGKLKDHFHTGKHLRGVAGWQVGNRTLLLVAADGKLTAFELQPPK